MTTFLDACETPSETPQKVVTVIHLSYCGEFFRYMSELRRCVSEPQLLTLSPPVLVLLSPKPPRETTEQNKKINAAKYSFLSQHKI